MSFKSCFLISAALLLSLTATAQTVVRRPSVTATGRASVFAAPDQVKVTATVTTQAPTAQDATSQNATRTSNLLAALRKLLGTSADIKTLNVSVSPVYRSSGQGQPPAIVAYSASNTVEVTLTIAGNTGAVIDTASQNGATSIGGLRFGLKDPEPARVQALRMATQQARSHAEAMAFALGRSIGNVLAVQESAVNVPIVVGRVDAAATTTPIDPGTVEVQASVVLEAELN